ncbi:MAG: LacI family transcriptional regulator [Clostridiales bacterium]|nr:LacI family transcriptional regulator [Clostridiales bacterium]
MHRKARFSVKIVTIRDVAKAAGVSISTVSRVLNERQDVDPNTRARVEATVRKLNYIRNQSASNLKQQSKSCVGVILSGRRNAFLTDLAEEVMEAGHGSGFTFIMDIIDEKANQLLAARKLYMEYRLQGVIILGANLEGREEEVKKLELPQVYATIDAGFLGSSHISSVSIDHHAAGFEAASRLLQLGHRRIALLGYFSRGQDSTGARLHGAVAAMREAGIPYDESLFTEVNFTMPSAYMNVKRMLAEGRRFTALFAASDIMAIGAIRALHEQGLRVPDDVSVIGFDGIELGSFLAPSLTSVRQPTSLIAQESVRLMRELIETNQSRHVQVPYDWLPGETTALAKEA